MRYFGVSKRVKVSDKVEPRDFDRSKVFTEVTPVIHEELVGRYLVTFDVTRCNSDIKLTLVGLVGVNVRGFREERHKFYIHFNIEATYTQIECIKVLKGFINVEGII